MKASLIKHLAIVELTRQPAKASYEYAPRNRQQRRLLKRALKRREPKSGRKE